MTRILLLCVILVASSATTVCRADFVTYADNNLFASDWNDNVSGSGGFISWSTTRVTPGLVGFPASHLTQLTGLNSQFIGIQYSARHIYTAQSFNIQNRGQPTQFNFNFWTNSQTGAVIFNALVRQNNSTYIAEPYELAGVIGTQFYNRAIPASAFTRLEGSGPSVLDLSSTASPLTFGYVDYNSSGIRNGSNQFVSQNQTQMSAFNVGVTFTAVPEPTCLCLAPAAAALLRLRKTLRTKRPSPATTQVEQ